MLPDRIRLVHSRLSVIQFHKIKKVFPDVEQRIQSLSKTLNHVWSNKEIPAMALLHRSALVYWPKERDGIHSNEVLEYVGDAFLNFFMALETLAHFPDLQEGELSRFRAALVGTESLANKGRELDLRTMMILGKSEQISTDKGDSLLADAFEAVIAALLLDGGPEKAYAFCKATFEKDFQHGNDTWIRFDAKSRLQQWTQAIVGSPPTYKVIGTEGTPQETFFIMAAFIADVELARAISSSKRDASKKVAQAVLKKIDSGELTKEILINYAKRTNKA